MCILDKGISKRELIEIPIKYLMYLEKLLVKLVVTEMVSSASCENKCIKGFPEMVILMEFT